MILPCGTKPLGSLSIAELREILLTVDGRGRAIKEEALNRLIAAERAAWCADTEWKRDLSSPSGGCGIG